MVTAMAMQAEPWAHPMRTVMAWMWNVYQRPVLLKMVWEFLGFLAKQQKQRQTKPKHQRDWNGPFGFWDSDIKEVLMSVYEMGDHFSVLNHGAPDLPLMVFSPLTPTIQVLL
ncbi:hypothetical protein LEMLEM_LOCUS10061 [Lemmus lemmus]